MKIVHVSNFTTKRNGDNFYGVEYKLNNGLTRLGHNVFSVCDRDIAANYLFGIREAGKRSANRKLRLVCETLRPEFLLLGHASLIEPETVKAVRHACPGIRIAHWSCDSLSFDPRNMRLLKLLSSLVDTTFVTTAGETRAEVASGGGRVAYMPNPVDSSIETGRAFDAADLENDLIFVGKPDAERLAICKRIRSQIPRLKFDIRGMMGFPAVHGAELISLLGCSRMGLALSRPNDALLYSSDRMAQLMGNGVLTFVDARAGFDRLFKGDELVCYEDGDALIAKLRHFMTHDDERRATAHRGWQRAHASFSGTLVAKWIVESTFGLPPSQNYAWPMEVYGGSLSR
ncbi:MAG TPA: glycosyltransferase [Rhizomicrobium sp.]